MNASEFPTTLDITIPPFHPPTLSRTAAAIACSLGITRDDLTPPPLPSPLRITLAPARITLLTGPSGAGKSTILRAVRAASTFRTIHLDPRRPLPPRPACDLVARTPHHAIRALARAGLADIRAMTRPPAHLSEGQRFRLRLAITLTHLLRVPRAHHTPTLLTIDEFASALDHITAHTVADSLARTLASLPHCACLLATPRTDITTALHPAHILALPLESPSEVRVPPLSPKGGGCRVREAGGGSSPHPTSIHVLPASRAHYTQLAHLHYRPGPPATFERILRAVHTPTRTLAGILVVSRPTIHAAWRAMPWPRAFAPRIPARSRARRINRSLRTISRVIVDERFRASGIATRLVRAYLRHPLTPRTEAITAITAPAPHSAFFARAGMTAYPLPIPPPDARLLDALHHATIEHWRLADPDSLAHRIAASPHNALLRRELRAWASARGATRALRDAPLPILLARAARAIAARPVAYAHTATTRKPRPR